MSAALLVFPAVAQPERSCRPIRLRAAGLLSRAGFVAPLPFGHAEYLLQIGHFFQEPVHPQQLPTLRYPRQGRFRMLEQL